VNPPDYWFMAWASLYVLLKWTVGLALLRRLKRKLPSIRFRTSAKTSAKPGRGN